MGDSCADAVEGDGAAGRGEWAPKATWAKSCDIADADSREDGGEEEELKKSSHHTGKSGSRVEQAEHVEGDGKPALAALAGL